MSPATTSPAARIRVVIADDHDLVRQGIRAFLQTQPDIAIVGEARDAAEAERICARERPDVALLDMVMPEGGGVGAARRIADCSPETRSVMLTSFDGESEIRAALDAGVLSYVLKDVAAEVLADVIRKARNNEPVLHPRAAAVLMRSLRSRAVGESGLQSLSQREREVLQCIAEGLSNAQIAERLEIGEKTVKSHVSSLLGKLDLNDRTQAAVMAWKRGWVAN
jgi:two-component system, NarL family, response regulator LiaR